MNIILRDIDPMAIKKIDELAKKKKISRSSYLKNMIENYTAQESIKNLENSYNDNVKLFKILIENNTNVLNRIYTFLDAISQNNDE